MNVLLFCIALIMSLTIIKGYSRGLIGLIYGVASWIFIASVVVVGSPAVYEYLTENTIVYDKIHDMVVQTADTYLPENEELIQNLQKNDTQEEAESDLPVDEKSIKSILNSTNLEEIIPDLDEMTQKMTGGIQRSADLVRQEVIENAARLVTNRILHVLAGIFCYLVAKIICIIVRILINIVTSPAPISFLMHLTGAVLGAAEGYLYAMIILLIISQIRFLDVGMPLYEQVQSSPILTMLYTTNPLLKLFQNFF